VDAIHDNNTTLKSIELAKKLDKELPEAAKEKNTYFLELKKEYPSFFDEDSGNSSIKDGLKDIEKYVTSERDSLKSELSKVNGNIKNLIPESNKNASESSNNPKRNLVESDSDAQPSYKKASHSNDKDNNSPYSSQSDKGPSQTDKNPPQGDQASFQNDDLGSF
jgi:hypothetical protein